MITYSLQDDGTMDTVVQCICDCGYLWIERIAQEDAADYRDKDTGVLSSEDMYRMMGDLSISDEPCPNTPTC